MNKVLLCGRLVADPEVKRSTGENATVYGRYTLAVDRSFKKDGGQNADFIPCTVIGKNAEFAEKYLAKGTKVIVEGSIQTGNYTNKEGKKVFTQNVLVSNHEFAESKKVAGSSGSSSSGNTGNDFINVPEGVSEDEGLPW